MYWRVTVALSSSAKLFSRSMMSKLALLRGTVDILEMLHRTSEASILSPLVNVTPSLSFMTSWLSSEKPQVSKMSLVHSPVRGST